ncbi:MAG: sigma-70 family RNA polymerase sigma factor [Nitrospirota bacterium]
MRQELDDVQLIERSKKGDVSAFEQLVLKYEDKIYNLCRHMLGNAHDAEDAAQDVFLKAYQNLNKFRPEASLHTWLYRIAVNTCIDYRRKPFFESLFKSSKEGDEFVEELPADSPSPDRLYESKQISNAIQLALGRLSERLRMVILLKEIEGLSYEEIADVLDVSIGTVKSRISRAREELKKLLKKFMEQK